MSKRAFASLFVSAILLAAALRAARLDLRPMHHDEANQAVKFGQLLEKGDYRYDPADHHGPSLYYLSLPFAKVLSDGTLAGLSETTLRLVTAAFGLGTLLLLLLFTPLLGRAGVAWAALALAVSPVMVYFSRFYIQETILVFFIVGFAGCVWRYILRPGWGWAAAAGLCGGMMYATKETAVIAFGAVAAGLLVARPWRRLRSGAEAEASRKPESAAPESPVRSTVTPGAPGETRSALGQAEAVGSRIEIADDASQPPSRDSKPGSRSVWSHGLIALGVALIVSFLLFSSFLQNPRGFLDSVLSFKVYFARAGEAGFHIQPWHYYLGKLAFSGGHGGVFWTEGLVLLLALAGAMAAFASKSHDSAGPRFLRFLAVYSILSAAVYSIIPYKTPWNMLPFYIGFVMLAGSGGAALIERAGRVVSRVAVSLLLAAAFVGLALECYSANFVYPADPRNPYVYAQTTSDFLRLVRRVEDVATLAPERRGMLIEVIAGPYETWPLPWYLRGFGRVGYWTSTAEAGDIDRPSVVIASPEEAAALEPVLSPAYRSEYYGLRPGVLLTLSVRNDLWEALIKGRAR